MTHQMTTLRFGLRVTLVIAALISLCVSKNVGPQFFPLPGLLQRFSETRTDSQLSTSRSPSSESDNFRVPMLGQTQKRGGTDLQPQPLEPSVLRSLFEQPVDVRSARDCGSAILFLSSALVTDQPGRAPPNR